jgi:putative RNA 2'-phosphotransferase
LTPTAPPDRLYHGTSRRAIDSIRRQGLSAQGRNHLHLSEDEKTALAVGGRHGHPAVLTVRAREMNRDGYAFYRSASGVWLTDAVPASYLVFPSNGG